MNAMSCAIRRALRGVAWVLPACLLGNALAGCATLSGQLPTAAGERWPRIATATPDIPVAKSPECDETPVVPSDLVPPSSPLPPPGRFRQGGTLSKIYDNGEGRLRVGVSRDTQTRGAWNPVKARFEGFDIDILTQVAMALFGVEEKDAYLYMEFYPVSYRERWAALGDRDGDGEQDVHLVASTNTYTCARAEVVGFSAAYFTSHTRFVTRRVPGQLDSGVDSAGDLAGKRVCVPPETTTEEKLVKLREEVPSMRVVTEFDELTDCLVAFQQGEVDVLAANDASLAGVLAQDATAVLGSWGPEPEKEYYSIAYKKGDDELGAFVNGVLEGLRLNRPTWFRLCERWDLPQMPCDRAFPPVPAWRLQP